MDSRFADVWSAEVFTSSATSDEDGGQQEGQIELEVWFDTLLQRCDEVDGARELKELAGGRPEKSF